MVKAKKIRENKENNIFCITGLFLKINKKPHRMLFRISPGGGLQLQNGLINGHIIQKTNWHKRRGYKKH
jgi:hypothetical protein